MTSTRRGRDVARGIVVVTALVLAVWRFVALDASSHSASDTLRPWAIELAVIAAVALLVIRVTDFATRRRRG